jgi:quercetin dioxygenase-like cupin family protein
MMRICVLGGTRFVGRAVVEHLTGRGHELLVVHRGRSEPDDLPAVEHLHVDRPELAGQAARLQGFDGVVDSFAMTADHAEAALAALPDGIPLVVLSSMDVDRAYSALLAGEQTDPVPLTEDSPVRDDRYPGRRRGAARGSRDHRRAPAAARLAGQGADAARLDRDRSRPGARAVGPLAPREPAGGRRRLRRRRRGAAPRSRRRPTLAVMGSVHRRLPDGSWEGVARQEYLAGVEKHELIGPADGAASYRVRYFEVPPGGRTALERHPHDHGVVIQRGRASVTLGDERHELAAGDVVYVSGDELHCFEALGDESLGFICVAPPRE